jgi:pSer/pThr/pTyr-binding forkhead associated (FHA) protein
MKITFNFIKDGLILREETFVGAPRVIKVGKLASSDLRLDDQSCGRMHAVVEVSEERGAWLIDLGSAMGTFVNGLKMSSTTLRHGDDIVWGATHVKLRIE